MTVVNRETIRDEIVAALTTSLTGSGKPVSSIYGYQIGKLNGESPVVLVLSRSTHRETAGVGSAIFNNTFELELQILVYDGAENNPLNEQQREDKVDEIEAALAGWFVTHQNGAAHSMTHRSLTYTPSPTSVEPITYLDGNPYLMERVTVRLEAQDTRP